MAKISGTVRRSDLEGGHWQLEADDGNTYVLDGGTGAAQDGARVEVEGKVDRQAMSLSMTGPVLKVRSLRKL